MGLLLRSLYKMLPVIQSKPARQLYGAGRQVDEDLPTDRGAISGLVASRAQSGGAQARRSSSSVYSARDEF